MAKYVFETEKKIETCNDCPMLNQDCDYGVKCNLKGEKYSDFAFDKRYSTDIASIPDDCPLKLLESD